MAKKEKQKKDSEFNLNDAQKRMEKYYKACESEKKGKATVLSLIGASVFIFVILLIIILKMSGVGQTIVFTTDENGNVSTSIADSSDVSAQNVLDVIVDEITDQAEEITTENQ
ncbi:MAG: hypothetical protein IKT61_00460 [Clostridia bacterium]|nr:hypothetical protein [Clostridia bacterium]